MQTTARLLTNYVQIRKAGTNQGVSQSHSMSSQKTRSVTPTKLNLPLPLMPANGPVPPSSVTLRLAAVRFGGLAKVIEEVRRIGGTGVDVMPDAFAAAGIKPGRDNRRFAGTGRTDHADEQIVFARLIQQR